MIRDGSPPRGCDVYKATGTPEETVRQLFKRLARADPLRDIIFGDGDGDGDGGRKVAVTLYRRLAG